MTGGAPFPEELMQLYRAAVRCRLCVDRGWIQRPVIDAGQPRSVGPRFFESQRKVLIALINPGTGKGRTDSLHQRFPAMLSAFADGQIGIEVINKWLLEDLSNWGTPPGRFTKYLAAVGLDPQDIAIANIALCANDGNDQPRERFEECFPRHTARLLQLLSPHLVLLMGFRVWGFGGQIAALLPHAAVVPVLHFAQRGRSVPSAEIQWVREILSQASLTGLVHRPEFPHKAVHALSAANRDERNRTPTARPVHPGGGPLPMRPSATLPSQFVPTHGLWRNVRQPFKPGCNGDVVWQLILRGPFHKDRKQAVTRKFLKEGFAHCRNNPNAKLGHPVGRAGQYPSKCVKYGLFSPAGRDIWIRGPAFDDPRMNPDEL
jgi:hypothetical protein